MSKDTYKKEYVEPQDNLSTPSDLQEGFTTLGFNNVSNGIESYNYVAATSGWKIHSDGTSEFN